MLILTNITDAQHASKQTYTHTHIHITLFLKSPYSINARQLHANVDDHHAEHLPADFVIEQQSPH